MFACSSALKTHWRINSHCACARLRSFKFCSSDADSIGIALFFGLVVVETQRGGYFKLYPFAQKLTQSDSDAFDQVLKRQHLRGDSEASGAKRLRAMRALARPRRRVGASVQALPEGLSDCVVAVGREEHVEGALRALGDGELGRPVVVVGRRTSRS
jgi:hypothetical protein